MAEVIGHSPKVTGSTGPRTWETRVWNRCWWSMYQRKPPSAARGRNSQPSRAIGGGPVAACLCARTWAATCRRRSGTSPVAGTATSRGLTMLPNGGDLSSGRRPETGTVTTIVPTVSPRPSRTWCRAPATATRTALLVVAPCRCAAVCTAARSARTTASCRRGPVGWFSELGAARGGRRPPPAPMDSRSRCQDCAGWRSARSLAASASRASIAGAGAGRGNDASGVPVAPSISWVSTASPPTPSASAWCSTITRARVFPAGPVTSTADHNGALRGSGLVITDRAVSSSAGSSPGSRQATARTWRRISKPRASIQIGPPQPGGTLTSRWRSRGTAGMRSARSWRARSRSSPPPSSSIRMTPNCSGTSPQSIARNARSDGLARSITG